MALALTTGFIGDPIFTLLFVGLSLEVTLNLLFPQLPLGLAVGCMMVAVPAAIVPIPLASSIFVIVAISLPMTHSLLIFTAALIVFSLVRGLVIVSGNKEEPLEEAQLES